jgi:hypothetical protein
VLTGFNALNRRRTRRDASTVLHTPSQLAADTVSLCKHQLVENNAQPNLYPPSYRRHERSRTAACSIFHDPEPRCSFDARQFRHGTHRWKLACPLANEPKPLVPGRSQVLETLRCRAPQKLARPAMMTDVCSTVHTISTHMYLYVTVMRATPSGEYTCGDGASSHDVHVPSPFPRCMI